MPTTSAAESAPAATAAASPSPLEPTIVTFAVSDPEVLLALSEYQDGAAKTNFLVTSLKVGVLALKAARGTLDSDTLRREGDRVMEELGARLNTWRSKFEERVSGSLAHYFDPQAGTFIDRVNRLTCDDGELASVVRRQVVEAQGTLSKVFEQFVGENSQLLRMLDPAGDNQLVQTLRATLDVAVQQQNEAILAQFSLDNKSGALVRLLGELTAKHGDLNQALSRDMAALVAEFSLDKEDSALSRLVSRVESAQSSLTAELSLDNENSALQRLHRMFQEHQNTMLRQHLELANRLDAAIQSMNTRRDEAAKSTRHGVEFEETLGDHLRELVRASGDVFQETGSTTGVRPNCKVGDYVITVGPEKIAAGARIVIEAKESASYDLVASLDEAELARNNRQAEICVFVHSTRTAPAGIPTFQRFGRDLVVRWNPDDDENDVWLEAALMVATALSVKAVSHNKDDAASFQKIDNAIERVRKALDGFEEVNTSANTIKNSAERILNRARIMQEALSTQVQAVVDEIIKVKVSAAKD
jgi:hypothetical protein